MTTRQELIKTITANAAHLEDNMHTFWRAWAEDLIKGGVPADEVIGSMISVAAVQGMVIHGSTHMAQYCREMADKFEFASVHGCEYPARDH